MWGKLRESQVKDLLKMVKYILFGMELNKGGGSQGHGRYSTCLLVCSFLSMGRITFEAEEMKGRGAGEGG
jgi:hypothetical protein